MTKHAEPDSAPPCYAVVHPGLEAIAGEEICRDAHGKVKRSAPGLVVFRVPEVANSLLRLRTVEDVFLLAWGTDRLTYRAEDLEKIQRWTAREADWSLLLRLHHLVRPKPKGKPTYRLVTQMTGTHGYRRIDAGKALARGLAGKLPASWREADDNAAVEIWLTIHGATAVCGLRLSDRTMRHRTYKEEHLKASLRPTIAAAMIRLANAGANEVALDPMCGAGTILAEQLAVAWKPGVGSVRVWGGDLDVDAVRSAAINLRRLGQAHLVRWDARRLPLLDQCVDRIISNPPFGKQLGRPEDIGPLYRDALAEYDRVLRPGGRGVFLVSDTQLLKEAARSVNWQPERKVPVRVLGQQATINVWRKES
jgi:23S rRNA G2445 N2-methylase RlmL